MRHLYLIKFTIFMAKFIVFLQEKRHTNTIEKCKKQLSILRRNSHNSIKIAFFFLKMMFIWGSSRRFANISQNLLAHVVAH